MRASMMAEVQGHRIGPELPDQGLCKHFFTGYSQWSGDNTFHKKKRAGISFHDAPCLHIKRAAIDVLCGNHGQLDFQTSKNTSDKKTRIEYLWKQFFSDPSQWWDNRSSKGSSRGPDFKHKMKSEALWIDSWLNPPWVKEKFATMTFDQIESNDILTSWRCRVLSSSGNYDKVQKLTFEGRLTEAVHLLELLTQQTSEVPQSTFVCLLRGCTRRKAFAEGKFVHALIVRTKNDTNIHIANLLIGMYSACGSVPKALAVFTAMTQRNVFSWTAMISAYIESREYKKAVILIQQMHQEGIEPDKVACVVALKACANIASLEQGQYIHSVIIKEGFDCDLIIQSTLIDMYAKCGSRKDARDLFDHMTVRNVVSWNVMIASYVQDGLDNEALDLYQQMKDEGVEPNSSTFVLLLKACASISALQQGKQLHSHILQKGLESEMIVQTTLVDMYSKCGCLKDARELFDHMTERNVVSWNTMITGYTQKWLGKEALYLYMQMKDEGLEPDNCTIVLLLKACAISSALQQGKQLHSLILQNGLESELIIQTSLLDMYSKCGCLKDAREVFDRMTIHDVVSWTAMIAGYSQEGLGKEALDLYEQMKDEGVEPDDFTFVLLMKACGSTSSLNQGKHLHSLIIQKGLESNLIIQTTLVDMYSKCGCLKDARELFDHMTERNVVSWNAMIAGYAQEGLGKEALDLYKQMMDEGLQPDEITYTCVLSACSHSGLVDEGCYVFESMSKSHGVTPSPEHYGCMVDLLGRAGHLPAAEDLVLKMPIPPSKIVWMTLLGAARKYANTEIGRHAFQHCVELEPDNAAPYLLLIDIFLAAGRPHEVAQLRKEMNDKGLKTVLGCSWFEGNDQIHTPQDKQFFAELNGLA